MNIENPYFHRAILFQQQDVINAILFHAKSHNSLLEMAVNNKDDQKYINFKLEEFVWRLRVRLLRTHMIRANFSMYAFNRRSIIVKSQTFKLNLMTNLNYYIHFVVVTGNIVLCQHVTRIFLIPGCRKDVIYKSAEFFDFTDTNTMMPETVTLSVYCMRIDKTLTLAGEKKKFLQQAHFHRLMDVTVCAETGNFIEATRSSQKSIDIEYVREDGRVLEFLPFVHYAAVSA